MVRSLYLALILLLFTSAAGLTQPASPDPSIAAIDSARAATIAALKGAPLGFRRVLFVTEAPGGFAIYDPRPNDVFKPGEPLIVYTEPVGITWQQDGDKVSSKLVVDFEVRSPDPSCNPYLAIAAILGAGLDGIRHEMIPPPPVNENIYRMDEEERRATMSWR